MSSEWQCIDALIELLSSEDVSQVGMAVELLTELGPACVPELLKGLSHEHRMVRLGVAAVLSRIGTDSPAVIEALQHATNDECEEVREVAAEALRRLLEERNGLPEQAREAA